MDKDLRKTKQEKHIADRGAGEVFSDKNGQEAVREHQEALETTKPFEHEVEQKRVREEIENRDLDDSLKLQASSSAKNVQSLDDKKKIAHLLEIAKSKGVIFAVAVAKKMNDPYILDSFHDLLAKEGYYKEFLK